MKRFHFPLDRVLAWRNTQVELEQSKLAQMLAGEREIVAQLTQLDAEAEQFREWIHKTSCVSGADMAALEHSRHALEVRQTRLHSALQQARIKVSRQQTCVAERSREAKLIQRLKERRFRVWTGEMAKELEQQAQDLYLARWKCPRA